MEHKTFSAVLGKIQREVENSFSLFLSFALTVNWKWWLIERTFFSGRRQQPVAGPGDSFGTSVDVDLTVPSTASLDCSLGHAALISATPANSLESR